MMKLKKRFLMKRLKMKLKQPPKTTINAKVVQVMKKLQALNNNDANKILVRSCRALTTEKHKSSGSKTAGN